MHHDAIRRGQELASPGYLVPSKLLTAWIDLLPDAPKLRSRARVRVHLGTAEVMASAVLLDRALLEPGGSALVQLFLSEPVVGRGMVIFRDPNGRRMVTTAVRRVLTTSETNVLYVETENSVYRISIREDRLAAAAG